MLALTVKQPWATLIIAHGKDIENRTWPINHRGPILIHAGKRDDPAGYAFARDQGIVLPDDLPRGGVIGQVDVIACTRDSDSIWAAVGQYHWRLANPREHPFDPMRGQLGLFQVGGDDLPSLW